MTGSFVNETDWGVPLVTAGHSDGLIVSFSPDGNVRWVRQFGGTDGDEGVAIASDPHGQVVVVGALGSSASVGGPVLECPVGRDLRSLFVAAYAAEDGAHRWSRCLPVTTASLAVGAQGEVVVVGEAAESADLGGGLITVPGDESRLYVARFAATDGRYVSHKTFTLGREGSSLSLGVASAITADGDIVIGGNFGKSLDLGKGAWSTVDGPSAFIARLSGAGEVRYAKLLPWGLGASISSIAMATNGDIIAAGRFSSMPAACGSLAPTRGIGNVGIVASFAGADGAPRWATPLQGWLTLAAADTIVVAGTRESHDGPRFDSGEPSPIMDFGPSTGFVAKLELDGELRWIRFYSGAENAPDSVALSASGKTALIGELSENHPVMDFGAGPQPTQSFSHYLLQLGP